MRNDPATNVTPPDSDDDTDALHIEPDFTTDPSYACLPASLTKHLAELEHPLPSRPDVALRLKQISSLPSSKPKGQDGDGNKPDETSSTGTTETTLWLGAQVMACYVSDVIGRGDGSFRGPEIKHLKPETDGRKAIRRKTVLELGGGVGYLALVLASLGYDVISTDIPPSLHTSLLPNIAYNLSVPPGSLYPPVTVKELDWSTFGDGKAWLEELIQKEPRFAGVRDKGFDVLITTDTIYSPTLIQPLIHSLRALSLLSPSASSSPLILLAIEARDPILNALAVSSARAIGFSTKRVAGTKVRKAVEKGGRWGWGKEVRGEWGGVEVWRWRLEGGRGGLKGEG